MRRGGCAEVVHGQRHSAPAFSFKDREAMGQKGIRKRSVMYLCAETVHLTPSRSVSRDT